ncbi:MULTISPECIES: cytochrome c oxidase assembly factor Coa1 family protein [Photorhabdus]|uniref:Cytochrome oxidase complex assembly protein 1 n=1 Tax=Photorhabdus thracensis TaxID=230089 RepID=A0A0F7LPU9_9GAMM|nr:cytochrome c oxidase assembly factor Coa1 family protein [Photorhabdus thracensis]AKH63911.1 hypothetical protein VY86_11820 [Photorhabdus thracensis]
MKIKKEWSLTDNESMTGTPSLVGKHRWLAGKWKWVILCMMPIIIGGVFAIIIHSMKSSEPYEKALSLAQSSSVVKNILGQPIEVGWFVSGSISNSEAALEIPIKGNRSGATVYVDAEKHSGHWRYKEISVQPDDGSKLINLLNPSLNQ